MNSAVKWMSKWRQLSGSGYCPFSWDEWDDSRHPLDFSCVACQNEDRRACLSCHITRKQCKKSRSRIAQICVTNDKSILTFAIFHNFRNEVCNKNLTATQIQNRVSRGMPRGIGKTIIVTRKRLLAITVSLSDCEINPRSNANTPA